MPEAFVGCWECLQNKSQEEIELTRRSRKIDRLSSCFWELENLENQLFSNR